MSAIALSGVLSAFKYKPEDGFKRLKGGSPCIECLSTLRFGFENLLCLAGSHTGVCVSCESREENCSGVPVEIWGAAQATWNKYIDLILLSETGQLNQAKRRRVVDAISSVASEWGRIAEYISNPVAGSTTSMEDMQHQELSSIRELHTLSALVSAKILTDTDDIMARLASTQPMYIRDDAAASALTDAIDELIDCDTSPAGGVTE